MKDTSCDIKSVLPPTLDQNQHAYRSNRSVEDAVNTALYTALEHLEQRDTYVRMLFADYSSAFNTIVPSRLITKMLDLGLGQCYDYGLSQQNAENVSSQNVRLNSHASSNLIALEHHRDVC